MGKDKRELGANCHTCYLTSRDAGGGDRPSQESRRVLRDFLPELLEADLEDIQNAQYNN